MRRFGDFQSNADSNIHELIKEKSHNLLYFTFNHWAQFVGISVYNMQSLYLSAFEKKNYLLDWPLIVLNSVQSLSLVRLFVTPWIAALQASLSITNSLSSLKLMSIE